MLTIKTDYSLCMENVIRKLFQVLWDSVAGGEDWCVAGQAVVAGLMPVVSSLVDPTEPTLAKRG